MIVLNQCTFHGAFKEIQDFCLNTWVREYGNDITILNYFGAFDKDGEPFPQLKEVPAIGECVEYEEDGIRYLIVGCEDLIDNYDPRGLKQIMAFEHVINNYKFEYLYRTGCSSYVVIDNLLKSIEKLPDNEVYAGSFSGLTLDSGEMFYFVIGCDVIISSDVIELVVENKSLYLELVNVGGYVGWEDVALGRLLRSKLKITKLPVPDYLKTPYSINCKLIRSKDDIKIYPEVHNYRFDELYPEMFEQFHKLIGKL